ncbi:MAG: hypothetical protein REI78_09010 [Pedobacter sp.]|nr:hypothetical protein [Pedobacter sp.]MDQ8053156.1 hypothetical protein [Pedobacter sp.]
MNTIKFKLKLIIGVVVLVAGWQSAALAHDPPYAGKTDCGIIQSGVFYSDYYSPPSGTPAASGSCSWVKQSNTPCATRNYGGTNYTLYNYKWICNAPLDSHTYILIGAALALGYFQLRRKNSLLHKHA